MSNLNSNPFAYADRRSLKNHEEDSKKMQCLELTHLAFQTSIVITF